MKTRTKISWADFTLNPWEGCTKVSDGCRHCYAETRNHRYAAGANWGPGAPRRKSKSALADLATINRRFGPAGDLTLLEMHGTLERFILNHEPTPAGFHDFNTTVVKPQVFSLSLGDILDPEVPADWLAEWLAAIADATNLEFLLLTKRPERFHERMEAAMAAVPLDHPACERLTRIATGKAPHVAWGTSVENQRAVARIGWLARIPAAARFISCEPLIGPVELAPAFQPLMVGEGSIIHTVAGTRLPAINLVITGGESGHQGRPMHPAWVADIDRACREATVPHHFKQWGEWAPAGLVEQDANQANQGNRLWLANHGEVIPWQPTEPQLGAAAMHRTGRKTAIKPEINGGIQQPRLRFP